MKLSKIFAAAIILASAAFTGCNLDFSNLCEDKWVVTNYYTEALNIKFGDSTTAETIAAATLNGTTLTPATDTFSHKADTSITIENDYIAYTESFSYSDSKAKRTLVIKDAKKYEYNVTTTKEVTFILNKKTYPNTLTGETATEKENEMKYTITTASTDANKSFIIYKNKPTLTFYDSTSKSVGYTASEDTTGKICITIQ
ncbi:hypothetical protein [Treponema sp. C6A8]|uniref:hypothetical protein n=1 Tax=Treponema sp. C6A8 TaxID=1410609 RepID=UPI0004869FE1|nr:hypothetical protein [Treponema sp. C6A8]